MLSLSTEEYEQWIMRRIYYKRRILNNMKIPKSNLKENYYYEYTDLYAHLPDKLEVPEYKTEIFTEAITHREILKKYNIAPYTVEQAFAVAADCIKDLKNDFKGRFIYFKNGDALCRLFVWRDDDGRLDVRVYEVCLDGRCGDGSDWVFLADVTNVTLDNTLESSDTLSLDRAIQICKEAGYKIYKEM